MAEPCIATSRACVEMASTGWAGSPAFCAAAPLVGATCRVRTRRVAVRRFPLPSPAKRRQPVTCALPWARTAPAPLTPVPVAPVPVAPVPAPVASPPPAETVPLWRRLLSALRGTHPAYFVAVAVFLLAYTAWTISMRRKNEQIRKLEEAAAATARRPMAVFDNDPEEESGDNALWLNLSLFPSVSAVLLSLAARGGRCEKAWRLFRKNTSTLISDTLQPILDEVELPPFISRVEIVRLVIGNRPPLVRRISRLPSRARSELQYSFIGRLVGDLQIDLIVSMKVPVINMVVRCPVTVADLDLDSKVWCGFSLAPSAPFVRRIQWALMKLPTVKLSLKIARLVPVTAIPILSSVLDRLFTRTIPKEFLLPKTQIVDLEQNEVKSAPSASASEFELADVLTVTASGEMRADDDATFEQLKSQYPALWALFDAMDTSEPYGKLSPEEVVEGLSSDWGFASTSAQDKLALFNLLDEDDDGVVTFAEFVSAWPDLRNVFVPRRFDGVIAGVLLKGKGLPVPRFGYSDPYVVFTVDELSVASKKNFETSKRGKLRSDAVWNESFSLECEKPDSAVMTVEVREGSPFAIAFPEASAPALPSGQNPEPPAVGKHPGRLLGVGRVRVQKLRDGRSMKVWVSLTPRGGSVLMELSYAQYVDARPL